VSSSRASVTFPESLKNLDLSARTNLLLPDKANYKKSIIYLDS